MSRRVKHMNIMLAVSNLRFILNFANSRQHKNRSSRCTIASS
uniref:Uncharacterized protein n=1 Tax=Setaria italica TaxID=4555 RepID=K3Y4L6_SETIT